MASERIGTQPLHAASVKDSPEYLGSILNQSWREGHDAGYRRAVNDTLVALRLLSDEFIRGRAPTDEKLQAAIYAYEEKLETKLSRMSFDSAFVEDGLGI